MAKQLVAVLFASAWSFIMTLLILWAVNKLTPVKINQQQVGEELDTTLMEESAYGNAK